MDGPAETLFQRLIPTPISSTATMPLSDMVILELGPFR